MIECVPLVNVLVVQVATPEESAARLQPVITVPASRNVTTPAGVPALPVTVAVKVTDAPSTEGFPEEPNVVEDEVSATGMVTLSIHARSRQFAGGTGSIAMEH